MVEAKDPVKAVQEVKMNYENVSQVAVEVRATESSLVASVSVFIDAEQDDRDYVELLSELYDAGFEMTDKGIKETGRRLVKGKQEL